MGRLLTRSFVGLPQHSAYIFLVVRNPLLLFGYNCHPPNETALLPASSYQPVNINDYCEELVVMPSLVSKMVAKANQEAKRCYKHQYDKSSTSPKYQIGDWVFVYFPTEETMKLQYVKYLNLAMVHTK